LGNRGGEGVEEEGKRMSPHLPSIQVFLSHRYKSPEVNLYFWDCFSELAEVQFEVDVGTLATCVTRLERTIRRVDAFVGIYPYPVESERSPTVESRREASRYFRLELDLALRSGKPALVFYDSRYGHLLDPPPSISAHTFDTREILGGGGKPKRDRQRRLFQTFVGEVRAFAAYQTMRQMELPSEDRVGLLLPESSGSYSPEERGTIESTLREQGFEVLALPWPPTLDLPFHSLLQRIDWIVTDIGPAAVNSGIPAFLHGQFFPSMRLLCTRESSVSALESTLFAEMDVGYPKDILRWQDTASLREGLEKRIAVIKSPVKRINTSAEAIDYFRSAALRPEAVFLSYCGANQDVGAAISSELKKRFRTVFDYRDGRSIATGKPWLDEVFQSLAASAIGIPLLSANYIASENCLHETREMISRADLKQMTVLPVKLRQEAFDLPPWVNSTQYARYWEYPTAAALVEWLIQSYDRGKVPKLVS
jgi:hypothetical protein